MSTPDSAADVQWYKVGIPGELPEGRVKTVVAVNNPELGKISKEQRAGEWDVWQTSLHNPDFSKYAELCGALGIHVAAKDELDAALARAIAHEGPALVEIAADATLV